MMELPGSAFCRHDQMTSSLSSLGGRGLPAQDVCMMKLREHFLRHHRQGRSSYLAVGGLNLSQSV